MYFLHSALITLRQRATSPTADPVVSILCRRLFTKARDQFSPEIQQLLFTTVFFNF